MTAKKALARAVRRAARPIEAIGSSYFNRRLKSGTSRMLFISGHMRSGSTLLLHILNSNPEIIGFGETHLPYESPSDFGRTILRIHLSFRRFPQKGQYVLDKVLWTRLLRDPIILADARTIFLIREPSKTLSSLIKLLGSREWTPQKALEHYVDRLRWIRTAAARIDPEEWTYTTYDELIDAPQRPFERIQRLLNLSTPLTSAYDTMWSTGTPVVGDPSPQIRAGRIVASTTGEVHPAIEPLLPDARSEFDACREVLQKLSIH